MASLTANTPPAMLARLQALHSDVVTSIPRADNSSGKKRGRAYTFNLSQRRLVSMNKGTAFDKEFPNKKEADRYIRALKRLRELLVARRHKDPANGESSRTMCNLGLGSA